MTFEEKVTDDIISLERKRPTADLNGDYLCLEGQEFPDAAVDENLQGQDKRKSWRSPWWWLKVAFSCAGLLLIGAACTLWGGPLLINKVVVPFLEWERTAFDKPVLALILFASISILPVFLVPTSPSMWLAGMTFGYVYGFLLITGAVSLGMSLPFLIGSLFRHRIHRWLERWPEKSAIVRLAGEGDWHHQFRAVTLIRISPFPYLVFNYAAVATNVKYCPYIVGSLLGIIPEIFVSIYSGILIRNFADASTHGKGFISAAQIVFDVLGFGLAVGATIVITVYAKKALRRLQLEEELL